MTWVVFYGLVGGMGMLFAVFDGTWGWARLSSVRRALLHGELREARITEVRELPLRVNRIARYHLSWVDAAGQRGQSLTAPPDLAKRFRVKSRITVYVDPTTERSWWRFQL